MPRYYVTNPIEPVPDDADGFIDIFGEPYKADYDDSEPMYHRNKKLGGVHCQTAPSFEEARERLLCDKSTSETYLRDVLWSLEGELKSLREEISTTKKGICSIGKAIGEIKALQPPPGETLK